MRRLSEARYLTPILAFVALAWGQNALGSPGHGGAIGGMELSPDGRYVVLSRTQDGATFLYKVALDSGSAIRLTTGSAGFETSPSYSPDGKQIGFAYTAQRGQPSRIYVMDADGKTPHPLYTAPVNGNDFFPRFAPDDSIYFARTAFFGNYSPIARPSLHEWDIYSVNARDGQVRQITNKRLYRVTEPSLSRDGKKMLFSVETENGSQLQLYSLDSHAPPKVFQPQVRNAPGSPVYGSAALSPDGESVIFMAASEGGVQGFDYDVYRLALRNGAIERLTTHNGYATNLSVSDDGKTAVFLRWSSSYGRTPAFSTAYLLDVTSKRISALPISGSR
jgi:Tol biopolymer transport system component